MASYLVLTPPAALRNDEDARFIADKFSWVAFIFPAIWLLFKRQWIAGIAVAILQALVTAMTAEPRFMLASLLIELALRLLVALEGPAFVARRLEAHGWTLQSVIATDDLALAEMIYDHETATHATASGEAAWHPPALPTTKSENRTAFGLFENYGER
ncbi:DUF2628 domain-containing protein [Pararhizobium sp. BT-229]|uniref:DUF2628 domain-containing protein n=1 Tax=Pararhizobium sp. BT-229 TaxID=2986923 RepID=UPI0021F713E8|nr:DUF2628 domain-containing protein [Pararhizobium sp. BT-229]MCV9967306.1 DUF2628 domain-containing protein [Pararhizobium sp. BT-229]